MMPLDHSSGRDLVDPLPETPIPLLTRWLAEARASDRIRNPEAMALATVDELGAPRVRFVLCRGFDGARARFSFYTHFASPKGQDLDRERRASAAIYWDALGRQVRLSGRVERASDASSDAYFASRHRGSQLSAWASVQSEPIGSRAALEEQLSETTARLEASFGDEPLPRPPGWGGYLLEADRIELWAEGADRVHDRAVWTRSDGRAGPSATPIVWAVARLQP